MVQCCHLIAGGAVNEHRVEDVHADDLAFEALEVALATCLEGLAIVVEVDAIAAEHGIVSAGDAHHVEHEAALEHQLLALLAYLLNEAATHGAHATDEEVEHLVFREEERVVYDVEGLAQPGGIYHK